MARNPRQWWNDVFFGWFPQIDFLLAAAATVAAYLTISGFGLVNGLLEYLQANGPAIYGAVLSAFTALLGFAVAVLAIVCAIVPSSNLRRLTVSDRYYNDFWNAFTLTIRTLGVCTCASFAALFLTASSHLRFGTFMGFCFLVALAVPGVIRAALALEVLVKGIRDASKPGK